MQYNCPRLLRLFILCALIPVSAFAQNTYTPPKLSHPDSWSMVVLPDPQTYVKFERNQPLFELMTAWISENADPLHIRMVLCTGDLVEQNEMPNPDGRNGNQSSKAQWESVARAFGRLDGKVPYIPASGNHDFGYKSIENRHSNFDKYFPADKNFLNQKMLRDVSYGANGMPTLANATFELISPQGQKYLIMALEFAPRDTIIEWANQIVNQDKYKDHRIIVLTHSYLNAKNEPIEKEGYPLTDGNYGAAIWKKLVHPSKNIQMVVSGHIGAPDDARGHVGFRTDLNSGGKKVNQMVFNAQAMGGGWNGNGGDGWLRLLEFLPDGKTVKVKTFSPFFAISPSTQKLAWRTEPFDEFTFQFE